MSDDVKPDGYNTPVPTKILTPDRVETRIGTLEFADGFPTEATAQLLYDHLDFLRGVEAFLSGVPAASLEAMRIGMEEVGVTACHQVGIVDQLLNSDPLFLTGNTDTVYVSGILDLERDGPTVVEIPPGCGPGTVNDAWFRFVTDMGRPGPDRGQGGKYLIVPSRIRGTDPRRALRVGVAVTDQLADPARPARRRQPGRADQELPGWPSRVPAVASGRSTDDGVHLALREAVQHHPRQRRLVLRRARRRDPARTARRDRPRDPGPARLDRDQQGHPVRAGRPHAHAAHGGRRGRQRHRPRDRVQDPRPRGVPVSEPSVEDRLRRQRLPLAPRRRGRRSQPRRPHACSSTSRP